MLKSYGWVEEGVIHPVEEVIHTFVIIVNVNAWGLPYIQGGILILWNEGGRSEN